MNTTASSRIVAVVGAAAVVTITITPVAAQAVDGTQDRPCFMVRPHWNDTDGPQPTCPNVRWTSDTKRVAQPATSARITDSMP